MIGLLPPPPSRQQARLATHRKNEKERHIAGDRWGGRRWARSQIIRWRESLVLYKSFNTLFGHLLKQENTRFMTRLEHRPQLDRFWMWAELQPSCEIGAGHQNLSTILELVESSFLLKDCNYMTNIHNGPFFFIKKRLMFSVKSACCKEKIWQRFTQKIREKQAAAKIRKNASLH
jgi:hypothetical protein